METLLETLLEIIEQTPLIAERALAWLSAIVAAASAISAVTRTPADDRIVARLHRFLEFLALNIGHARRPPASPEEQRPAPD